MQIGELTRGFPELGFPNKLDKETNRPPALQILPIRETDKPYQFDFPKYDSNDIQTAIKRTIKEAVLGRLFNSNESPSVGLLDGFDDNATPIQGNSSETSPVENPVEESSISYSYNYSYSESFSLDINIEDNQLSLDLSYTRSVTEESSYTNNSQGIEYSNSALFVKSLDLSLSVDLGDDNDNPTLLNLDLNKSTNRSFSESLSISPPVNSDDASIVSSASGSKSELLVNSPNLSSKIQEDTETLQEVSVSTNQADTAASVFSGVEINNQQAASYEKLLLTQLQQTVTGSENRRSNELNNYQPATNTIIQEYLLGLR